jgi:hypothetical protein
MIKHLQRRTELSKYGTSHKHYVITKSDITSGNENELVGHKITKNQLKWVTEIGIYTCLWNLVTPSLSKKQALQSSQFFSESSALVLAISRE